jgi:arylsulfatase
MGNRAVRMQKWKLVMKHSTQKWELYDMESDRAEMNDLSMQYPELVDYLEGKYLEWEEETGVESWDSIYR